MLAFIVSLPRSGSTVLTSLLDQTKGVVCHPESSFPQVYGELSDKQRQDPQVLAAYYLGSTFAGTPLSLAEATECMQGSLDDILHALGYRLAEKLGRPVAEVHTIVWKTTRTVGMNDAPLATNGRFVVLRRHPHNVYESQFRVGFGRSNRNPLRFALFRESYETAFSRIPRSRRVDIDYDDLPGVIADLLSFLGIEGSQVWDSGVSSLEAVARDRPWLSEINDQFLNKDPEKRARLARSQTLVLDTGRAMARAVRPLVARMRRHYDLASLRTIAGRAETAMSGIKS
jgi:hypothetical protein